MKKIWITTIVGILFVASAVPVEAGMQVALKCDLTRVYAELDKVSESDTTLGMELQMTDGLAIWKGNLDSALVASDRPMAGFATYERVVKFVAMGVNFNTPKGNGLPDIVFSNTRGLYFIIVFLRDGERVGAAMSVEFSPFGVGMGPSENRWHTGGWFSFHTGDWEPWPTNGG